MRDGRLLACTNINSRACSLCYPEAMDWENGAGAAVGVGVRHAAGWAEHRGRGNLPVLPCWLCQKGAGFARGGFGHRVMRASGLLACIGTNSRAWSACSRLDLGAEQMSRCCCRCGCVQHAVC